MLLVLMLIIGVIMMLVLVMLAIVAVGIRQEPPEGELTRQASYVAAVDPNDSEADTLEGLDNLRSRRGRDVARHKAESYQKSGYVECQSQLIRWPDLLKQQLQASA
jgi:hypothetical protein